MTADVAVRDDALSNIEAYDCWAPTYPPVAHNPLMRAEQDAMLSLWPEPTGACALDLACGTGRYALLLASHGARCVVGVDLAPQMLARAPLERRVRADMTRLPFADSAFDLVVCGLAVGHVECLDDWMHEVARVLVPGGHLVFSDFHPKAVDAGMTRSFVDSGQRRHTLRHRAYDLPAHREAGARAGLVLEAHREVRIGLEFREPFEGSAAFYRRWQGLAVVLALRMRKAREGA